MARRLCRLRPLPAPPGRRPPRARRRRRQARRPRRRLRPPARPPRPPPRRPSRPTPSAVAAERSFRAMGSDAHLIVVGGLAGLLDTAVARITQLEQRWSRFLPGSEVSRLNRSAGRRLAVSPDTITLVEHAVTAWRLSGGAYDPTLLGAVIRAGYDRSFEDVLSRPC